MGGCAVNPIDRTAERAALTACATRVMAAANGHGVRWARVGCIAALTSAGYERASAESLASSMTRFAVGFSERANALHAEFNLGAIA